MGGTKQHADMPDAGQSQHSETLHTGAGSASHPEASAFTDAAEEQWLYSDKPLEPPDTDSLGLGAYADALALLMDWKATNTPLTIAINGPWGSGKTSLAKMAEARLPFGSDWDAPHVICWFDAWANDDAPHLGAAFAAAVAKAVNRQRYWWWRLVMPLPTVMLSPVQRWRRRLWFAVLAVVLAAAAIFWPTGRSLLTPLLHPGATISALGHGTTATRLAWPLLVVAVIILAQRLAPGIQGVARWIDEPGSEAARGSVQEASEQLGRLIRQALRGKRRLMIFVDNLERCRPPRAVEVCEVVSQLIGHPQVVTVLIGDLDTIALSAEIKYAALETVSSDKAGTFGPNGTSGSARGNPAGAYGRAYLEKLIQIQVRLPPPLPRNLRKMLVPVGNEPRAFPQDDREPKWKFLRLVLKAVLGAPRRLALAFGSIVLIAATTIVTLGTDVVVALVGLVVAALSVLVQRSVEDYQERQEEQTRTEIDEELPEVKTPETTFREDEVAELAHRTNIDVRYIRKRMRQRIMSPVNELRRELDRAVLEILPLSPRGAKRMFNHAHLLLYIGLERELFDKQPRLTAGQFATWVALTERWPTVAAAITSDPTLTGRLEEAAKRRGKILRTEQLTKIENRIGITGLDSSLLEYMCRSESLVPVARLLVNFSPDPDGALASGRLRFSLLRRR